MKNLNQDLINLITKSGYIVYDIELDKKSKVLSVLVELPEGRISLDDCIKVSEIVNNYLDSNEISEEEYLLDVCSPGIERPLKTKEHYQKQLNHMIEVNLYKKHSELGQKNIKDILNAVDDDGITIGKYVIPFKEISKANAVYEGEK